MPGTDARALVERESRMRQLTLVVLLCFTTAVGHCQQTTALVISNAPIYVRPEILPTPLRVAATGTKLKVLKIEGDWTQVEFHDRSFGARIGWVQLRLVKINQASLETMDLSVTEPGRPAIASPGNERRAPESPAIKAAPVPDRLMEARSAFVVNGGVWFKVFDKFYAELAEWNRFRLVQRKEDADITILLSSAPGELFGAGGSESKFYMRISDTRDGTPLWADTTREARSVSNSGKRLVANLRKMIDGK
jgi:hypothetical protein